MSLRPHRAPGGRPARGAAAVEFAFVFPILFLLIYGVIVYSYIFVLQESLNYAAQEAAEATVAVEPDADEAEALRQENARATAKMVLSWLPQSQAERVLGSGGEKVEVKDCPIGTVVDNIVCPTDTPATIVRLRFDLSQPTALFPALDLYMVGRVPPLPNTLVATAVVRN